MRIIHHSIYSLHYQLPTKENDMQAMQYKINLPADYDMNIIKKRIKDNGYKTDRFEDLLFKAYLITEKANGSLANRYCPLYIWQNDTAMTKFIFDGFFDNIITSFGWQTINIGITLQVQLTDSFAQSQYVLEEYYAIPPQSTLKTFTFKVTKYQSALANVVIYNPDKWHYVNYTFFKHNPSFADKTVYSLLHLSLGE